MDYNVHSYLHFDSHWGVMCQVKCMHDYYPDKNCGDFQFSPTSDSEILMRNLRILFKPDDYGFVLLYEKKQKNRFVTDIMTYGKKLTFKITPRRPEVYAFSELPFHLNYHIYHLHNRANHLDNAGNLYLHPEKSLRLDENFRVQMMPMQFVYNTTSAVPSGKIQITDFEGNPVHLQMTEPEVARKTHSIDLRHCPEGKYFLKTKGEKDLQVFCVKSWDELTFGYLDIFWYNIPNQYQFIQKTGVVPKTYLVHVDARSIYWKYILIGRNNKNGAFQPEDIKVSEQGKAIQFTKPEKIILNNGVTAYSIQSKDKIQLVKVKSQTDRLEMKLKNGSKWSSRTIALPKPKFGMIKANKEKDKLFAVTYVYI